MNSFAIRLCTLILLLTGGVRTGFAQEQAVSLEECLSALEKNYPETDKFEIQQQINDLNQEALSTDWLPQLDIDGRATYQSEVTELKIDAPNFPKIEPLSKDQYQVNLNLSQKLFDGGITSVKKELQELTSSIDQKNIEISIETLKEQVASYYFNVLLADENLKILESSLSSITSNLDQVRSGFRNGVAKASDVDRLEVEVLKLDQQIIDLKAGKKLSIRLIDILTALNLNDGTVFNVPQKTPLFTEDFSDRPEFEILKLRTSSIEQQDRLSGTAVLPKLKAIGQYGYGRPGFNFLKNEFTTYYRVGVQLNWDISSLYTRNKEHRINEQKLALVTQDSATAQNRFENRYAQQTSTLEKSEALIEKDSAIIALREKVTKASRSELKNGISTATDYLVELNAEIEAKQQLALHRIQREQAAFTIKILTGK